jgi:phosphoribosylanthranilate isomerase
MRRIRGVFVRADIKICGLSTLETVRVALKRGADYLGFIHFSKSPRHLSLPDMADLVRRTRAEAPNARLVSVVVDPDDALVEALMRDVRPGLIQLHGRETPQRVAAIRARANLPVIKAVSVSEAADLGAGKPYEAVADHLLFDAKTPKDAALPGGMGLSFDWNIMRGWTGEKPWFLAGGLDANNIAEAARISGARGFDISSGVESSPGVKDPALISDFLRVAKSL